MPASVSTPADENELVAVAPKYALLYTESSVEEAPPVNWWSPVHVGAIDCESAGAESLRMKVVALPLTAVRPRDAEGFAPVALVTRHVPLMEKHPPARSTPLAKVLVAEVPVTLRYVDVKPPVNVVVEGEPNVAAPVDPLNARAATVDVPVTVEVAR